ALVDRHGAIAARTLVLWGMDDPWQKAVDGQQLADEIPNAIFEPVQGASHWIPQDAPEKFSASILKFLASKVSG
ncbi:MAG: alpha/beta hydrolase, partial [Cyanobacteria bacterium J06650_10]